MQGLIVFIAGFFYVFLLGFQQQNITHEHHGKSVVTSYLLAFALVFVVQGAVHESRWWFVVLFGSGSAIGASLSILVHKWFRRPRNVIGEKYR